MIIHNDNLFVLDGGLSNRSDYWSQDLHPEWAALKIFRYLPGQRIGAGVEPHYHDNDEFWLFVTGHGEVWLDGRTAPITPNTLIYTPMGTVHRFQMFTDFSNVPAVTVLERAKRPIHILTEVHGPPTPTVPGFIIPGGENNGPFPDRGPRCPVGEMRALSIAPGEQHNADAVKSTEYWVVLDGALQLNAGSVTVELTTGDLAIIRSGGERRISSARGATVALASE
jgi:mannose-6-phosphate isomerase-like protein (cupin superfamily)